MEEGSSQIIFVLSLFRLLYMKALYFLILFSNLEVSIFPPLLPGTVGSQEIIEC